MNNYKHVKIFRGDTCGVGKSDSIKYTIESRKEPSLVYRRIPIYGELNRNKLIEIHRSKIFENDTVNRLSLA